MTIGVKKLHPNANLPKYGTAEAACFDLAACFDHVNQVTTYNDHNIKSSYYVDVRLEGLSVSIYPGERMMVPTGLIFRIPTGYSIRIHPRSGLALKSGLVLANQEAVIDSDYTHETFILLHNTSAERMVIRNGDRLAQGEVVVAKQEHFYEELGEIEQKTDRIGGLGSTGVSS